MSDDVNNILGQGAPNGFPEGTPIGTTVRGEIIDATVRQSTDMETGKPKFWEDGKPQMELDLTLQDETMTGDENDGERRLFARGNMLKAIKKAMKDAGVKTITVRTGNQPGGKLAVKRTGQDEPKTRGFKGAWTYTAQYKEAVIVAGPGVDDLLGDGEEPF